MLASYLNINHKKLRIAKYEDSENVYIALADLIDCSLNQKNSKKIFCEYIQNNDIEKKIVFTDKYDFYIPINVAIDILGRHQSVTANFIVNQINLINNDIFAQNVPQIINDFEYKISIKP